MLWGLSPALDLLSEISDAAAFKEVSELNILLIGAADSRHILATVSKYYTHSKKIKLNFYVVEVLLELLARQIMLLTIALEPTEVVGLKEKVRLWMEVYANTLVRPSTASYIAKKAHQLVFMVTDDGFVTSRMPAIKLDRLKFKEHDGLETVFNCWKGVTFNIAKSWDTRLRQALGVRYDSKEGVFDWDAHMKLRVVNGGEVVNPREYKHWRATGVAFTWLETECSEPNITLASAIVKVGDQIIHHGYMGDITSGPYMTFGLTCEDTEMLKTQNGINAKRATDLTERNLFRMFYEIQHQHAYRHTTEVDEMNLGIVITELDELALDRAAETPEAPKVSSDCKSKENYRALPMPNTEIIFLPVTSLEDFVRRQKFENIFHLVWIAQNVLSKVTPECLRVAKDGAVILAESRKFAVGLSKKEIEEFGENIKMLANDAQCELLKPFDAAKDAYAKFHVKRSARECLTNLI